MRTRLIHYDIADFTSLRVIGQRRIGSQPSGEGIFEDCADDVADFWVIVATRPDGLEAEIEDFDDRPVAIAWASNARDYLRD